MLDHKYNVFALVNRKKHGLIDFATAVVHYGNDDSCGHYYLVHDVKDYLKQNVLHAKKNIVIVFDNSISSILAGLYFAFKGFKIIYMYHEPGGFIQKRMFMSPFLYSIFAVIAEEINKKIANLVVVPLKKNIPYGDCYAPLLVVRDKFKDDIKRTDKYIGFLGSRRRQRLPRLLLSIQKDLAQHGYEVKWFPGPETGYTFQDKLKFINNSSAIWNYIGRPYNQSGVTLESIAARKFIFVSSHDPYAEFLTKHSSGNVLNLECELNLVECIVNNIEKSNPTYNNMIEIDSIIGKAAFNTYWLPIFREL